MNLYNENLHASVLASLSAQELQLQKTKATLDASMFSLYYAQGARITAAEELDIANRNYAFQQQIVEQAVIDSDISTNMLSSVNQSSEIISESVKNTSVAAANVQIAANAVLKLASDVGSIFSIVNAADFDTEIYVQSKEAYRLMNRTAYLAEKTSQLSMEASAQIAEVPITSLTDKAQVTDTSIKNLLEITTTDFNAASETVSADSQALATSNSQEKAAEGTLENVDTIFNSNIEAYRLSNTELNLDLQVNIPSIDGDATYYTVSFDKYKSPFKFKTINKTEDEGDVEVEDSGYPVKDYYIFLVKNMSKEIFSVSDAEGLILEEETEKKYIKIPSTGKRKYSSNIYMSDLKDADGNAIQLGERYVVFVFAVLDNAYKKVINTFDDYLSAPSSFFTLKNTLTAAVPKNNWGGNSENIMKFTAEEDLNYEIQYRCIFLPHKKEYVRGLLTVEGLASTEIQTQQLDDIYAIYNPEIEELEAEINDLNSTETGLIDQKNDLDRKKDAAEIKSINKQIKEIQEELKVAEKRLKKVEKEKKEAIDKIENPKHIKPGFFFNYTIATALEIDSYSVAELVEVSGASDDMEVVEESQAIEIIVNGESGEQKYKSVINSFTKDNFGNSLIPGNLYTPVVLAMSDEIEVVNRQFTGALSDFQKTQDFTYTI